MRLTAKEKQALEEQTRKETRELVKAVTQARVQEFKELVASPVWKVLAQYLVEELEAAKAELEMQVEGYKLYRAQGSAEALRKVYNGILRYAKQDIEQEEEDR